MTATPKRLPDGCHRDKTDTSVVVAAAGGARCATGWPPVRRHRQELEASASGCGCRNLCHPICEGPSAAKAVALVADLSPGFLIGAGYEAGWHGSRWVSAPSAPVGRGHPVTTRN